MGNLCRLDLDVAYTDVFHSLARQFARSPGATAVAFAPAGESHYQQAQLLDEAEGEDLREFARQPHNVAFLTDLEGLAPGVGQMRGDARKQLLADRYVRRKSIVSFDLNFAPAPGDAAPLDTENRYRAAKVAAHQILCHCEKYRIPLWLLVYSGRGLHLHFKTATPVEVGSPRGYGVQYKRWCELLERALGGGFSLDRNCRNPARLMRLPGSQNMSTAGEVLPTEVFFLADHAEAGGFLEDMQTHFAVWTLEPYPVVEPRSFREAAARKDELYRRFECDGEGVWHILQTEDGCVRRWLCDPLTVEAMSCDTHHESWGRVLRFRDAAGHPKRWTMPMALLASADGFALWRALLSKGFCLSLEEEARVPLMHYLLWSQPQALVRAAE